LRQPLADYGVHTAQVNRLEGVLAQEPCDRSRVRALLEQMLAAGDNRGALTRAATFSAKCGDEPKLREVTYGAHQRLGELDQAASDLTALIALFPANPYYHAWYGAILEQQGNLDGAASELRQALVLYPAATDIPQDLANVYERQGKFCDATVPLEGVLFRYVDKPFSANVKARIAALEEKGACTPAGAGVRVRPRSSQRNVRDQGPPLGRGDRLLGRRHGRELPHDRAAGGGPTSPRSHHAPEGELRSARPS
jgi:tetratricopeptide (TPR) repeat protein